MTQNNISTRLNFDSIGRSVSMDFPQNQKWKKCRSVFFLMYIQKLCFVNPLTDSSYKFPLHDANSAKKKQKKNNNSWMLENGLLDM